MTEVLTVTCVKLEKHYKTAEEIIGAPSERDFMVWSDVQLDIAKIGAKFPGHQQEVCNRYFTHLQNRSRDRGMFARNFMDTM